MLHRVEISSAREARFVAEFFFCRLVHAAVLSLHYAASLPPPPDDESRCIFHARTIRISAFLFVSGFGSESVSHAIQFASVACAATENSRFVCHRLYNAIKWLRDWCAWALALSSHEPPRPFADFIPRGTKGDGRRCVAIGENSGRTKTRKRNKADMARTDWKVTERLAPPKGIE